MKTVLFRLTLSVMKRFSPQLFCSIVALVSLYAVSTISLYAFCSTSCKEESLVHLSGESTDKVSNWSRTDDMEKAKIQKSYSKLPLYFIQNNGQMDGSIRFYEKRKGYTTFFTKRGIYLVNEQNSKDRLIYDERDPSSVSRLLYHGVRETISRQNQQSKSQIRQSEIDSPQSTIIELRPLGANKDPEIIAEDMQEGKVNYLIGNDSKKWKTGIPIYKAVVYKEIYKNIDIRFYGTNQQMEYDIIVKPGACPYRIRFAYRGIEDLRITNEGDLEIRLKKDTVIQKKPYIYQEIAGKKINVEGKFVIRDCRSSPVRYSKKTDTNNGHGRRYIYGFQVASYDKRYPLVIDPALVYSTYLGGSSTECGRGIAVDTFGNAYITGETWSNNFPAISSLYKSKAGGTIFSDIFITKLNASGNSIAYSTYLGGSDDDFSNGIAVDPFGNVYITGSTNSTDFPTAAAIYSSKGKESDAFITKLNTSGNNLVYSTYLGGSSSDCGRGIAVDTFGNAYVTGWTYSNNFPAVSAILGSKAGGYQDSFITKINASGSGLVYSMYLGGSNYDIGNGIAVDTSGNTYVTGCTNSTDFPTSSAVYGSFAGGYHDAFVTKINSSGSKFVYSTYLGGSNDDVGYGIAVDASGNAYVTGLTWSNDFPNVSAIYKKIAGNDDAFISKLAAEGSIVYSTYLGGSIYDGGYGIAVDTFGNAYITGVTHSNDFPTTSTLYGSNAGNDDAFVTKLNYRGNGLVYSLYMGGNNDDVGYGIAVDNTGDAYVTGKTWSNNFPVASAIYGSNAGEYDIFITKIASMKGKIYGYVADIEGNPLASVSLLLKGIKTMPRFIFSDADGFFEFDDLIADTYMISAKKEGYKETKRKIKLEDNKGKVIIIKMEKK